MTTIKAYAFGMLCEMAGKAAYGCAALREVMENTEHWAALRKRATR